MDAIEQRPLALERGGGVEVVEGILLRAQTHLAVVLADCDLAILAPTTAARSASPRLTMMRPLCAAGYGISVDPNSYRNMRDAYPATISTQFTGASSFQAAGTLRTGIPTVVVPDLSQGSVVLPLTVGTQTFPEVFNRGYIQSFNLTVQRDIGGHVTVQAGYVGVSCHPPNRQREH